MKTLISLVYLLQFQLSSCNTVNKVKNEARPRVTLTNGLTVVGVNDYGYADVGNMFDYFSGLNLGKNSAIQPEAVQFYAGFNKLWGGAHRWANNWAPDFKIS